MPYWKVFLTLLAMMPSAFALEIIAPEPQAALPGERVFYVWQVRSDSARSIRPFFEINEGWQLLSTPAPFEIVPGEDRFVAVSVRVPENAAEGDEGRLIMDIGGQIFIIRTAVAFEAGVSLEAGERVDWFSAASSWTVDVLNTGNGIDEFLLELRRGDETVLQRTVTIAAGGSEQVTLPLPQAGRYTLRVRSQRQEQVQQTLAVSAVRFATASRDPQDLRSPFVLTGRVVGQFTTPAPRGSLSFGLRGPLSDFISTDALLRVDSRGVLDAVLALRAQQWNVRTVYNNDRVVISGAFVTGPWRFTGQVQSRAASASFGASFFSPGLDFGVNTTLARRSSLSGFVRSRSNERLSFGANVLLSNMFEAAQLNARIFARYDDRGWRSSFTLAGRRLFSLDPEVDLIAEVQRANIAGRVRLSPLATGNDSLIEASVRAALGSSQAELRVHDRQGLRLRVDTRQVFDWGLAQDVTLRGRSDFSVNWQGEARLSASVSAALGLSPVLTLSPRLSAATGFGSGRDSLLVGTGLRYRGIIDLNASATWDILRSDLRLNARATYLALRPLTLETEVTLEAYRASDVRLLLDVRGQYPVNVAAGTLLVDGRVGATLQNSGSQLRFGLRGDYSAPVEVPAAITALAGGRRVATIRGRVQVLGAALPENIAVRAGAFRTMVDAQGNFELLVRPGSYEVAIAADSLRNGLRLDPEQEALALELALGEVVELEQPLRLLVVSNIVGQVAQDGETRLIIRATDPQGQTVAVQSDPQGRFRLPSLFPGRYTLELILPSGWSSPQPRVDIDVPAGESVEVMLEASPPEIIRPEFVLPDVRIRSAAVAAARTLPPTAEPLLQTRIVGEPDAVLVRIRGVEVARLEPVPDSLQDAATLWQGRFRIPEDAAVLLELRVIAQQNGQDIAQFPLQLSVRADAPFGQASFPALVSPGASFPVELQWFAEVQRSSVRIADGEAQAMQGSGDTWQSQLTLPAELRGTVTLEFIGERVDGSRIVLTSSLTVFVAE